MEKVSRVLVIVIGFLTLLGALGFMFSPANMEPDFSVLPTRLDGWGTLRADLGGPFLGIAIFTFMGARKGRSQWLLVPLIFMATFLMGRTVHIVADGLSNPAIRSFVVEVVLLVALGFARRVLTEVDRKAGVTTA